MPRGRPKGSRNLSAYEKTKVKQIREGLSRNGITSFDNFNDAHLLGNISVTSKGDVFIRYQLYEDIMAHMKDTLKEASGDLIRKFERESSGFRYGTIAGKNSR
jgi:hypothetical protein